MKIRKILAQIFGIHENKTYKPNSDQEVCNGQPSASIGLNGTLINDCVQLPVEGIERSYNVLCFSDLGIFDEEKKDQITSAMNSHKISLIVLLGDMGDDEFLLRIKQLASGIRIVGVLGNHDDFDLYERFEIENINGQVVEHDGVKLAGLEGSIRYKDSEFPSYTQDESIILSSQLTAADILISHTSPVNIHTHKGVSHMGLQGITNYLERYRPLLNLHGHQHTNVYSILPYGTAVVGVYGATVIDLQTMTITRIF